MAKGSAQAATARPAPSMQGNAYGKAQSFIVQGTPMQGSFPGQSTTAAPAPSPYQYPTTARPMSLPQYAPQPPSSLTQWSSGHPLLQQLPQLLRDQPQQMLNWRL